MSFLPSLSPGNVKRRLPAGTLYEDIIWNRPTEWLDLNKPTDTPEKIIGLVAVLEDVGDSNYVAFHLDTSDGSSYSVNWGDGNTETLASNATHYHVYNYDDITSDTSTMKSTTFRGYRQAKFEVTLQGSATFSQIDFDVDGPYVTISSSSLQNRRSSSILDLFVSSSACTNIKLQEGRNLHIIEQIEVRNTSSNRLTEPRYLYQSAKRLQSIPFAPYLSNSGTLNYSRSFYYCRALKYLHDSFADPDRYWFKNPSSLSQTFENCNNLQYLPEGLFGSRGSELSNCSSFYGMFYDCLKLKLVPYMGMRTGSGTDTELGRTFYRCHELMEIPKGFSAQRLDNNGLIYTFYQCRNVKDWSAVFDGTSDWLSTINNSNISLSNTFEECDQFVVFPYIGQFTNCSNINSVWRIMNSLRSFDSSYTYLDFTGSASLRSLFASSRRLERLPEIKVRSLTDNYGLHSAFRNNESLISVKFTGMISYTGETRYQLMFQNCHSLYLIDGLDFSFAASSNDYQNMFALARDISTIKFPGTFRAGYASPRINVTVANHTDISGEYHINAAGTGYAQDGGNGVLTVAESGGNYTWTIKDSSDNTPTENSIAASNTQHTPWAADWSGATNAVTFTEVETGFKYTIANGGLRYCPIKRPQMLEIFNQLVTISHSATLDIRNNPYTADLTDDDKAIATNKGWTLNI